MDVMLSATTSSSATGGRVRHAIRRSSILTAVALVVAIGSPLVAGDVAQGGVANGPILATAGRTQSVVGGTARENAAATNARRLGAAGPTPQPTPQASGTPHGRTSGVSAPHVTAVAPAVASMDPATVAVSAQCDGTAGTWTVFWRLTAVIDNITVTAVNDPVNGVTGRLGATTTGLWNYLVADVTLPGNATVAAMAATVTLPDGSSHQENRTVQLGSPCIANGPVVQCDPNSLIKLSATANQVTAVVTGQCAGGQDDLTVGASDPNGILPSSGNFTRYAESNDGGGQPTIVRQVIAADLPPCGWQAELTLSGNSLAGTTGAGGYLTGGSGLCIDASMTVVEQCPHRFVVTVSNGADAALPTTFFIPGLVRTLAPGQSLRTVYDGASSITVMAWGGVLGEVQWQTPRICISEQNEPFYPRIYPGRGIHALW